MSKELLIILLQSGLMEFERTARAVPEDKLNWKPLDKGRTALDLIADAAITPKMVVQLLQSPDNFQPYEVFPKLKAESEAWTRDECFEHMQANTLAAIEAIRATPDEDLAKPITLPFGQEVTLPLGVWITMAYRSFMSRFGQINYIQTLYGDFDGH